MKNINCIKLLVVQITPFCASEFNTLMPQQKNPTLVSVGESAGVEGNIAERIRVKKHELADNTFTIPASVSAKAA